MSVVVIGGGVVGASAAYQLARDGIDVTLVDAEFDGRATSAGAGIISPWSSREEDADWYRIAAAGAEYYTELRRHLQDDGQPDFGYRQVGALRLTTDDDVDAAFATVRRRAAESAIAGPVEVLDGPAARALHPLLHHDGPVIHVPGAARLDGRRLRDALWSAARRRGARIVTGRATILAGDSVEGVEVDGAAIGADVVIDASGAWSPRLLEPLGLHPPVTPMRGQIVHLDLPGTDTSDWPMLLPRSDHYLLSFDDRVVVGATREAGAGFDYRLTAAGLHEVFTEALKVAPGLADAGFLEARIGFRPVGPDIRPLLGTTELPGLVIANGLGASGLTMGPYVGSVAAALAAGRDPGIELAPYDPLRDG
ncbi:NAD(P)/FAD-dependent oxidoreductase [Flexivirga oryzae]|uniref:D-amino-acid dehydrogenase n=1 Tax=Flexivirga oryzae TaxID=1794944 RepID=A0A839NCC7_9MICO|nr:FAD-dependent oxidoreductase [Flexivirga oryzae]MBB2892361.1 D-amino-acid dehydrogenase [Flexivirga oryzae]